jgi:hypothetical protein
MPLANDTVAKVVQPDRRQAGVLDQQAEAAGDPIRVQRAAVPGW